VSAETRAALEAALGRWDGNKPWTMDAAAVAAHAHLAAERSEVQEVADAVSDLQGQAFVGGAVEALKRVKAAVTAVWDEASAQHDESFPQGWVARALECIDGELSDLASLAPEVSP